MPIISRLNTICSIVIHSGYRPGIAATTSGQVAINAGKDVAIVASQSITFTVGLSSIKITPQGITLSGPLITSTATGVHPISGAMIRLN